MSFFGCMTKFCVLETTTKSYIEWFRTSSSSLKLIALAKYKESYIINCLFSPFFLPLTNRWSELPKKRKDLKDRNANVYNLCSPSPKTDSVARAMFLHFLEICFWLPANFCRNSSGLFGKKYMQCRILVSLIKIPTKYYDSSCVQKTSQLNLMF